MDLERGAILALAALAAGAVNSVAGGGTLISFPVAVWSGLPPLVANATNAVALTPASLGSAWAYRKELSAERKLVTSLLAPAVIGGGIGAALLLLTPARVFDFVVPVLVLGATGLLAAQNLRKRPPRGGSMEGTAVAAAPPVTAGARVLELLIGVYGGYFGAGIGILMLAVLDRVGARDIHRSNAVKTVLGAAINGTAAVAFVASGRIHVETALVMAAGAVVGGYAGAALARRVDEVKIRWLVVAIGLGLTLLLAARAVR